MNTKNLPDIEAELGGFASDLFARGYIISDAAPICPSEWREQTLDGIFICHHPSLSYSRRNSSQVALICLGIIFDTRHASTSQDAYLDDLIAALERSEQAMLDDLSHSNGRYLLFYRTRDGEHHILTDAAGIRGTLYHHGTARSVSSHLGLLALNGARGETPDTRAFKFGFPGRHTPLSNVYLLTPNTKLHFASLTPQRYWPLTPIAPMAVEPAAEFVEERLTNAYEWIRVNYDPFITITAGTDSRVTLAIAGRSGRYATYYRADDLDTDLLDRDTTTDMAARLGLDHTLITRENMQGRSERFGDLCKLNTFKSHIPGVAYGYKTLMVRGADDTVHIRSNLSEIGRMFYKGRKVYPKKAEDLVRLWSTNPNLRTEENAKLFREFAEITGFMEAPVELTSLFYWEHRMGSWHSQVAIESDIACESLSLYNCRAALQAMLSISQRAQRESWLLKRIIARRMPELTEFPLNGKPFIAAPVETIIVPD